MWTASRAPDSTRPSRTGSVHNVTTSRPTSTASMPQYTPNSMAQPAPLAPLGRQPGRLPARQPSVAAPAARNNDHKIPYYSTSNDRAIPYYNVKPSSSNGYESDATDDSDTAAEDDVPPMWQHSRTESGSAVSRLVKKSANSASAVASKTDDDSHSRSSTLRGDDPELDFAEKTPTARRAKMERLVEEEFAPVKTSRVPGPLESQLAALMSKLVYMEQKNPAVSVTPEEFKEMSARLKALEEEKKTWTKRHEAIWKLRDEDVENNIKIRGLLAKARRDLEAMTKLRDEDLVNVQVVRIKLADANRQIERLQSPSGRSSPNRASRSSTFLERRDTTDLFAVAKAAALQERALELEKRNSELLAQIEALKGGKSANIDDLNRVTAHQAWKSTVADLETKMRAKDAEIARLRASSHTTTAAAPSGAVEWHRVEALHEEHAGYRERMGAKLQALRSEKEALQRELHRKEDECHSLEAKVQSLQRRVL